MNLTDKAPGVGDAEGSDNSSCGQLDGIRDNQAHSETQEARSLIAALDHRDALCEQFEIAKAEAKRRIETAVRGIAKIENASDRLRVVLSIYNRAHGAKRLLAQVIGLPERRIRWLLLTDRTKLCRDCGESFPATWGNFDCGFATCPRCEQRQAEQWAGREREWERRRLAAQAEQQAFDDWLERTLADVPHKDAEEIKRLIYSEGEL
jgi:hypothetical protein